VSGRLSVPCPFAAHESTDLPLVNDVTIDALADNEPLDAKSKRRSSTLEGEAALFANSHVSPTLSIDLPSGVDPDTGELPRQHQGGLSCSSGHIMNAWCILPQETVALACLKKAHYLHATAGKVSIVDLGLPHAAFERAATTPWLRTLFGQQWLVETVRWNEP
jgi:hypothetical protein